MLGRLQGRADGLATIRASVRDADTLAQLAVDQRASGGAAQVRIRHREHGHEALRRRDLAV